MNKGVDGAYLWLELSKLEASTVELNDLLRLWWLRLLVWSGSSFDSRRRLTLRTVLDL